MGEEQEFGAADDFRTTRHVALLCAGSLMVLGCIGFAGWLFNIANFRSVFPGLATIKTNTAISVFLIGVSLWQLREPRMASRRLLGRAAGWLALLLTAATLAEYLWGLNLGIDQWMMLSVFGTTLFLSMRN